MGPVGIPEISWNFTPLMRRWDFVGDFDES
jgi:hypothetical protein